MAGLLFGGQRDDLSTPFQPAWPRTPWTSRRRIRAGATWLSTPPLVETPHENLSCLAGPHLDKVLHREPHVKRICGVKPYRPTLEQQSAARHSWRTTVPEIRRPNSCYQLSFDRLGPRAGLEPATHGLGNR